MSNGLSRNSVAENGGPITADGAAAAFEHVDDAVSIFDVDRSGATPQLRLRYTNPAHTSIFGTDHTDDAEVLARELPGTRDHLDALHRAVDEATPVELTESDTTGDRVLTWQLTIAPALADGTVTAVVTVRRPIDDPSERPQTLEAIFEAATDVAFVVTEPTGDGTDAIIREFSTGAERIFGRDQAAIVGESIHKLHASDETTPFVDRHERLRSGESITEEVELQRGDGNTFRGLVTVHPYRIVDRLFALGIVLDITERVAYERRLETQRDDLKLLNEMLRHDIRNDLTIIRGYLDLLEEHVDDTAAAYLETVRENTDRAIDLTKTARDLAHVLLQQDRSIEAVSLDGVVAGQVEELDLAYRDAVIEIEDPLPSTPVYADDMVEAVFRNILKNAVIHNDKSTPRVDVQSEVADDHVRISVADNGPGIPDEHKSVIFDRGETGSGGGTGLGLYLVDTLVTRYGGDVWIEDNDPTGTIVHVELTRATAESSTAT